MSIGPYILRRLLWSIPLLFTVSVIAFLIIQAPPGDYLTSVAAKLAESGRDLDLKTLDAMRERYGLDEPILVQYWIWISGVVVGDFGMSMEWRRPVSELIWGRMGLSFCVAFASVLFVWALALPMGIYSAVRKYTIGDYIITAIGFVGLAIPNFLFALVLLYVGVIYFGVELTGLFSPEYANAPWSWAKVGDLAKHLWIPVVIIATSATASLTRIMRANLLDELHKPYVTTARAKGLPEWKLLLRYPVRVALNPFVSTIGWVFPSIISGSIVADVVLNLPTAGPMLLQSLKTQDMYLAGGFVLLLCALAIVGMLMSDILLALLDPRVRYQ
jgi:peptide/nickel transport system permease protein